MCEENVMLKIVPTPAKSSDTAVDVTLIAETLVTFFILLCLFLSKGD